MTRILAIDLGSVRVGVALSDPLGITAQPLEVIHVRTDNLIARICSLIEQYEVERIVIGNPLRLDGTHGPAAENVRLFVETLRKQVAIPIDLWDERLTTAEAEKIMIAQGVRRDKRKASIDRVAAAILLQSYLDAHRPCSPEDF